MQSCEEPACPTHRVIANKQRHAESLAMTEIGCMLTSQSKNCETVRLLRDFEGIPEGRRGGVGVH